MIPDERSLGGRNAIELEHLNMRNKIVGARAMVNSRAAKQAAKPGKKKVYKDPFAEVREVRHYFKKQNFSHTKQKTCFRSILTSPNQYYETRIARNLRQTYRRVAAVQTSAASAMMTSPPKSYGMADVISSNRRTKRAYADRKTLDHAVNIYHLHRRMDNMGSVTERKKNRFDASVYPSMIRRESRRGPKLHLQPLDALTHKGPKVQHLPRPSTSGAARPGVPSPRKSVERPRTAPPARTSFDGASGVDLYEQFKLALMDEIIENRLYEESKIQALFRRCLKHNSSSTHAHLLRAIADIKSDLDVA